LAWYDNIPIFGWIFLKGKCRYCKASISIRYPLVELLTAILFTLLWLHFPYSVLLIPYGLLLFGLILATFVDLDHMWLPDRVTIGGMIAGPLFALLCPQMFNEIAPLQGLIHSLIGLGVGFGLFWCIGFLGRLILKKDAMGFGDVKLMGTLGAFFGMEGVWFITFLASLIGAVVGLGLVALGKRDLQGRIPFGPYLALAALIWMRGGAEWWSSYWAWATELA
jgi:leader peptidase (prepilin peptidase)/N-methyltransferase